MFAATTQVFNVDAGSFLAIVATAAIAGTLSAVAGGFGVFVPVVVVELVLGVVIGPQLLHLADVDSFTEFFGDLGLGMLFFFAGYEIDIERIRGEPLLLGLAGWVANAPDGSVEIAASGDQGKLDDLKRACARGPDGAWVDAIDELPAVDDLEFPFSVRR